MVRAMKRIRLTIRRRIIIAVLAIAVVHALFKWVPGYIERRPRFYEDAWARAVEVLKEEVGAAAVENGVFEIPREEISVASYGGVWEEGEWAFMVLPSGDAFPCVSGLNLAHLSPGDAQRLLATFRYLSLVSIPSMPQRDHDSPEECFMVFDGRRMVREAETYPYYGLLDERVAANAAARFCRSLVEGGLTPVELEEEKAAALCRTVKFCSRIRNRFEAALLELAAGGLCEEPVREAAATLAKIKRLVDDLENDSNWLDFLQEVPFIGELFSDDYSSHWRQVDVADALWACENLAGKSRAERLPAYERAILGEERGDMRVCPLVKGYPEDFTRLVVKHWDSFSDDERSSYLYCARICGDGGAAIAEKLVESDDLSARVEACCALYRATRDRKYAAMSLDALGMPEDLSAVKDDERNEIRGALRSLAELGKEDPSLEDVHAFLKDVWQRMSEADLKWGVMSLLEADEICAALVAGGGEENIDTAMEIMAKYDPGPGPYRIQRYGIAWSPHLWCEDVLMGSDDPHLAEAMLESIRSDLPNLEGYTWFPFARVLASKGDERLAALLREGLPSAEPEADEEAESPTWDPLSDGEVKQETAARALVWVVDCMHAEDAVGFLLALPDNERGLVVALGGPRLLGSLGKEDVCMLMGQKRCEPILALLYDTLLERRKGEDETSQ